MKPGARDPWPAVPGTPASPDTITLAEARRRIAEQRLRGTPASSTEQNIVARPADTPLPLSDVQRSIWFLTQLAPESPFFNECFTVRLPDDLDLPALRESFRIIVERHAIWRTTIDVVDGQPRQMVHAGVTVEITTADLSSYEPARRPVEAQRIASADASKPFELSRGPLVRALLMSLSSTEHKLFITAHHLVIDSVTFYAVFLPELAHAYDCLRNARPLQLAPLPVQYGDYSLWRRDRMSEPRVEERLEYWKERLAGAPDELRLPADRSRPPFTTFKGAREQTILPVELTNRLRALARDEGATLFTALLATLAVLFHRLTGQDEVVVGVPVASPKPPACERLIGLFANMVAVRVDTSGNPSFRTLLHRVRDAMIDAVDHSDVPFDRVVERGRAGVVDRAPLFQAALALQNAPPPSVAALGFGVTPLEADCGGSKTDFALLLDERSVHGPEGIAEICLGATLQYSTDLFDPPTIMRRLDEFVTLADEASRCPGRLLSELSCLSKEERRRLVETLNDTSVAYPRDVSIAELFEAQAKRFPDAVAIESGADRITYRELDERADRLARELRAQGVRPGLSVAVLLERSAAFVASLLAILKAGGTYVPLDPRSPRERLMMMIADARPRVLMPDGRALDLASTLHTTIVRADLVRDAPTGDGGMYLMSSRRADVSSAACVLYTSGSTGGPKGVLITHRGIARLVVNTDYVAIRRGDRVAHAANVCFDAASFEIWGALLSGATLVVIPNDGASSVRALAQTLTERRITTIFLTTAVFNEMAREHPAAFAGMHDVMFGGERADPDAVRRVLDAGSPQRLINMYGPTETTTFASWHLVGPDDGGDCGVPIGRPIANTTLYILDRYFEPVPVGVAGEIFIGGDGVAAGYLNRPDLTAERFLPDPFSSRPRARLYRTGDQARYRADGSLEFLGRLDEQVKIRGHRIEPGEVEAALQQHPDVSQCVVYVGRSPAGEYLLAARVRFRPGRDVEQTAALAVMLRAYLKQRLPDYMVPAVVDIVDEWPLTSTGKIDREAIKAAPVAVAAPQGAGPARDRLEDELTRLWSDLLRVSPVGVTDNFFDLGGHSLLAARMIDEVSRLSGKHLPLGGFFANPTIESLAQAVNAEGTSEMPPIVTLNRAGTKPPLFYVHGDFNGRGLYCRHLISSIDTDRPFHVVHPHGVDGRRIPTTIEAMAREHLTAVRQVQPHGPYVIGGYCNGALVAFEMAHQLVAAGDAVAHVILVDPPTIDVNLMRLKQALIALSGAVTGDAFLAMDFVARVMAFAELPAGEQARAIAKKICRPFKWLAGLPESPEPERADPTRDYSVVIRTYTPRVYAGRVTLIASETEAARVSESWARWCEAETCTTRGTHQNCTTVFVDALADQIRAALASA